MAKRSMARAEAIPVVEHDPEDMVLARTDGDVVGQFMANLRAFFTRARELETTSKEMLERANALMPPKTGAEDADLQRFVQTANAHVKTVTEHWGICQVLSRFHKRTTAARSRATEPAEYAAQRANQLHQRFVEDVRRREAAEAEQRRREAEERARQDRERELAELERAAVAAEEASPKLSEREEMFVDYYTGPYPSAERAAQQAGYKDAFTASTRLLASAKIQQAVTAKRDAKRARDQAAAVREQPVRVESATITVPSEVQKVAPEREYWSAELLDEQALVNAVCDGRHGIPRDVLTINVAKLNGYAKAMHELIDRWPGARAKKTTKVY